jgi:hypothetical protein
VLSTPGTLILYRGDGSAFAKNVIDGCAVQLARAAHLPVHVLETGPSGDDKHSASPREIDVTRCSVASLVRMRARISREMHVYIIDGTAPRGNQASNGATSRRACRLPLIGLLLMRINAEIIVNRAESFAQEQIAVSATHFGRWREAGPLMLPSCLSIRQGVELCLMHTARLLEAKRAREHHRLRLLWKLGLK